MPSQILHTLFGEDVAAEICRRLSPRAGGAAEHFLRAIHGSQRRAFTLGCQGPDIFYHSQGRTPVGLEYGTLLHRRGIGGFTAELFKAVLALPGPASGADHAPSAHGDSAPGRLDKDEIKALKVYALGFMTHAALDRASHPYIVYKSGWFSPSNPETVRYEHAHPFFERIIDALMLKRLRGKEVSTWDQEGLLAETCEHPPPGLSEVLRRALVLAFPERAGKDAKLERRVENTFHDAASFYRLTSPSQAPVKRPMENQDAGSGRFPLKKRHVAYLFPENLSGEVDFLNMEHRPWRSPAGEEKEDPRSFPEIYAEAVKGAADSFTAIFGRYLEDGVFPAGEMARATDDGGLSIVDADGKPCAPVRAAPLPLDEELSRQAALRGI